MTYADTKREALRLRAEHTAILASTRRTWPIGDGAVVLVHANAEYGDLSVNISVRTSDRGDSHTLDLSEMKAAQVARYAACLAAVERWKAGESELPISVAEEVPHA